MSDLIAAGRSNIRHTYLELAKAMPHTTIEASPELTLVTSRTPLTIGNMAIDFNFDDEEAARDAMVRLRLQFAASPVFRIFSITGDRPDHLNEIFVENGLREESQLQQMTCLTAPSLPDPQLNLAETEGDRRRVSEFMATQFSFRRTSQVRRLVSQTNTASRHAMFYRGDIHSIQAAMMISECDRAVGLYNLCVSPRMRKRGLGAGLLSFALEMAKHNDKPLVLQADTQMRAWYSRQGAQVFGLLKVFSLPQN